MHGIIVYLYCNQLVLGLRSETKGNSARKPTLLQLLFITRYAIAPLVMNS